MLLLIGLVVLIGVGIAAYFLFFNKPASSSNQNKTTPAANVTPVNPDPQSNPSGEEPEETPEETPSEDHKETTSDEPKEDDEDE